MTDRFTVGGAGLGSGAAFVHVDEEHPGAEISAICRRAEHPFRLRLRAAGSRSVTGA